MSPHYCLGVPIALPTELLFHLHTYEVPWEPRETFTHCSFAASTPFPVGATVRDGIVSFYSVATGSHGTSSVLGSGLVGTGLEPVLRHLNAYSTFVSRTSAVLH